MSSVPASAPWPSAETMIPDLVRDHPEARAVLDRYGLTGCGGDLGPVETLRFFARAHGVDEARLLAEVREAVAAARDRAFPPAPEAPSAADTVYRGYFTAAIVLVLSAGASWGAWLLWKIGFAGSYTSLSIHEVNAHGEAQVFGWVGLFIMGFAYQAFPRIWHTRLVAPRLAVAALAAMVAGVALRTVGMTLAESWSLAVPFAMTGGALEAAAVVVFVGQTVATFRRGDARVEPYVAFVLASLAWFVLQAATSLWHTWATMTAPTRSDLLRHVATYQAPLRDLQIHGMALFMVLGVSIRMLPGLYDLPRVPDRRAWWALALLVAGVVGETTLFVAYRTSGSHVVAAFLLVPWLLLAIGVALVALPWRLWRPLPESDRSAKFVRAAYGWLALSLAMLLLLPVYQSFVHVPFSHAYYGAIRHAVTVGFVSSMILGMGAKVVATLNGRDPRTLPALWGPFLLLQVGCFLRVAMQTLTDFDLFFFRVVGVSGVLEVAALAWWGSGILGILRTGRREAEARASATASDAGAAGAPASRRSQVAARDLVASVVDAHPATVDVFRRHGFHALANPVLRRTLARGVTIGDAAAMQGVDLAALLADLNGTIDGDAGG